MPENELEIYIDQIANALETFGNEKLYNSFIKRVTGAGYRYEFVKKIHNKKVERDWLEMVESCLIPLDDIVRNPRKFIKQEEDIVSIALAKRITTESVKHLAQHTNMISSIDEGGMITPERILNINKEESLEVYENRFVYTLLLKLDAFISKRLDLIVASMDESESASVQAINQFSIGEYKYNFRMEFEYAKEETLESESSDPNQMTEIQRVYRASGIVKNYLSSPFARSMRGAALVRPPITRTNAILKNPNLKKCLLLWQFVESYEKVGFSVQIENEANKIKGPYVENLHDTLFLNYVYMCNFMGQTVSGSPRDDARSRKMAKTMLSTMIDQSKITESDLKEIYDRLMAQKVKAKKITNAKYTAAIDKAIAVYKENKKIKMKNLSEKEKREKDSQQKTEQPAKEKSKTKKGK